MANIEEYVNSKRKRSHESMPLKLKSAQIGDLTQSVVMMFQKFQKPEHKEGELTPERIIKNLVRGLGSSNTQVQKNYFAALVTLMKTLDTSSEFSPRNFLDAVNSELHVSGSLQKGEEGEILMGRVLAFGVLVRSGALCRAAEDDQATAVTQLLQSVKTRSYLPLTGDPFLIEYLKQIDEQVFRKSVWPSLRNEVASGPDQTLIMFHILLVCEQLFPSVVSAKVLKQLVGSPQVLSPATVPALLSALKENFRFKVINHSAYLDIFKFLANAPENTVQSFWEQVEAQLLSDTSASSTKPIKAIKFFSLITLQLQSASQVLNMLTPKLLSWFMKKHKLSGKLQQVMRNNCREALDNLYKLCTNTDSSKTLISVIKKLLFDPGNILFEQLSGTKVVQPLMSLLKEKSVMKLATVLRAVITGSSTVVEYRVDTETSSRPWHNKERLYTVHLFCKLLPLPAMQANTQWRLEQLTFLFDMGFFTNTIGVELAGHVRESFFSSLNHKFPNLVDLRIILAGIVDHINTRLRSGDQLRIKVPSEVMPAWEKMYATAKQIGDEKKSKKEQWVTSVFQTMFYHIGLHLFKEAAFATDVLKELHSVYERIGSSASSKEEPHWTEVVVEMFLSLLSRNSQLHRHLIGCIFSHFCPIMIPQNIHQILQVLDPTGDTNPLLNSLDLESDTSSEGEESEENEEEDDDKESSDDGMTDIDEEDEKVNDKLRRAVVEALGDTGALTDVESVDLDDMDEEEAARVDKALSLAFKANRQVKTKKQPSHAKALTHFRLRVLDLVEVWLGSEPPLDLLVDTLLRLISLLEHSLVDRHQTPLEVRVRSVIRKLTATKKYDTSDCKSLHLGNILKSLLEKGNRTTTVYMSLSKELTACTLFIIRASQHIEESEPEEGSINTTVHFVLKDIAKSFFLQRDCLLTVALFDGIFRLKVPIVWSLAAKLPSYVFDPSVHPFRRSKALEFLMTFWNNRLLLEANDEQLEQLKKMAKRLYKGSVKMMEEPVGRIQPKFMVLLRKAFLVIQNKKWMTEVDWPHMLQSLMEFHKTHVSREKKANGQNSIEKMEVENDKDGDESLTRGQQESETVADEESEAEEEEPNSAVDEEADKNPKKEAKDIRKKKEKRHEEESNSEKEDEENTSSKDGGEINSSSDGEEETNEESVESESPSEEPPKKKLKKKVAKKKNHEKIKRMQLLKNNSKRLRMQSMAVGLDENVFSKYKMLLANNTTSPER